MIIAVTVYKQSISADLNAESPSSSSRCIHLTDIKSVKTASYVYYIYVILLLYLYLLINSNGSDHKYK